MAIPRLDHFIDGALVAPNGGEYMDVENPATGEVIAEVACGTEYDLNLAVAAAQRALDNPDWRDMTPTDRSVVLNQFVDVIQQNAQELAYLEAISSGGTLSRISKLDFLLIIDSIMTMADLVKTYPFTQSLPARAVPELTDVKVVKEPIGVCGLIPAWNLPMVLFMNKLLPALAAGNTVVVKPSELTPHTSVRLAQLLAPLLPPGVLNVVNGVGGVVGEAMTLHPGISKISFTGSTAVGKRILVNAAASLKRVTLELGGKGAAIVTADADLNAVAHGALYGVLLHSGQGCESGTRLLVHESIYEPLLEKLAHIAGGLQIGDPMNPDTQIGPMCHAAHGQKVLGYIHSALEQGARLVCGGERVRVLGCEGGFFIAPTILADCNNQMSAVREEIFGPVLAVIKYRDEAEAIAIANDSDYGLSAGIWTGDVLAAQKIARRLQAGSVWINDWHMLRTDVPFGGYKQSGQGREMGIAGLESYLETKAITTAFQRDPAKKTLTYGIVHTFD
ncbi:aldehyde dehydrogenase family protein [Pseudomonas arsenicoxydans]|uniref:Aldehyde dehydrogenase n=1 Tax=Pseudomonas arsenicoxydans TaxID=702115 RepID=A0A502HSS8_9PSED|nr:aldehyde dehydrogenase family protein [Pseudomonas arsenicoxydans]TPG76402.1 aldehyde dehydrogenase [Pseudomonas arsenicoxydans]